MLIIKILLFSALFSSKIYSEEKAESAENESQRKMTEIVNEKKNLPKIKVELSLIPALTLNIYSKKVNHLFLSEPYGFKDDIKYCGSIRYNYDQYPDTSLILLSLYMPYDPELFVKKNLEEMEKKNISLVRSYEKKWGKKGIILELEDHATNATFKKFMAVFGSEKQTAVVTLVYPEFQEGHYFVERLKEIVLRSGFE